MITTYAISFASVDRTESDRITLVDLVTDWQVEAFPFDSEEGYPPGLSMRTRLASDDPVFRVTVTDSAPKSTHVDTTTVTVALINGMLTFDLRIVSTPRTFGVVPHRPPFVPAHVVELVRKVLAAVPTYDADVRITDSTRSLGSDLEGQDIGALVMAPGRRLPVVVEVEDADRRTPPLLAMGPGPLVGLVHMVHLTTDEARRGYTDMTGDPLIGPGSIVIHWAGGREREILRTREIPPASLPRERERLIRLIIDTAARSVAAPRVPPPPRRDEELFEQPSAHTGDESRGDEDMATRLEQLEAMVDDMEASLADANRIITEQRATIDKRQGQVDELVLRNVSLESSAGGTPRSSVVASMAEALRIAQERCQFLVFHERALESGRGLEGPDPGAVLQDLWRLNEVARAWMSGEISGHSIKLACSQVGLNFAPSISDTARQKFEEDYLIDWRGRTVRAEAHLRRGRKSHLYRIHVWFDDETHQVVVAYIGRHLRDKGSSS